MRTIAPKRTLLPPNPCGGAFLLLSIREGAGLVSPFIRRRIEKGMHSFILLVYLARRIAPCCSRKLGSRFARLGRSQYETTRSAENRRGGDAYGWRRAEARAGSGSRENAGFRTDLGSNDTGPGRHRGAADSKLCLSRVRYALRHRHRVEGAAADGCGPYRRGGRIDLDPEAARRSALSRQRAGVGAGRCRQHPPLRAT